ncbi:MAG: hypothetical protein LBV33_04555 [Lachnospiraceae bacterium]|nr:hypothetical protein [Lachnospiraceae bacterium]
MRNEDKKKFRYEIIRRAAEVFALSDRETETLANKAGLSTLGREDFTEILRGTIASRRISQHLLLGQADVTERMFEYIKKGKRPTKETLIAIAISLDLETEMIQELLRQAGYILSSSLPNDMVILFYLREGQYRGHRAVLTDINITLSDLELPLRDEESAMKPTVIWVSISYLGSFADKICEMHGC